MPLKQRGYPSSSGARMSKITTRKGRIRAFGAILETVRGGQGMVMIGSERFLSGDLPAWFGGRIRTTPFPHHGGKVWKYNPETS